MFLTIKMRVCSTSNSPIEKGINFPATSIPDYQSTDQHLSVDV